MTTTRRIGKTVWIPATRIWIASAAPAESRRSSGNGWETRSEHSSSLLLLCIGRPDLFTISPDPCLRALQNSFQFIGPAINWKMEISTSD